QKFGKWCTWSLTLREGDQPAAVSRSLILSAVLFTLIPVLYVAQGLLGENFLYEGASYWSYWCHVVIGTLLATAAAVCFLLQLLLAIRHAFFSKTLTGSWAFRLILHFVLLVPAPVFLVLLFYPQADRVSQILFVERAVGVLTGYSVLAP